MQGFRAAIRYEAAFRQELALAILLIPAAFWLGRSVLEVFILIMSVTMVLVTELLNSAIEALADALSVEMHPLLGRASGPGQRGRAALPDLHRGHLGGRGGRPLPCGSRTGPRSPRRPWKDSVATRLASPTA